MSWFFEMRAAMYSNLVLFYPFLRTPGNIHSNTKRRKQNQKYGYKQDQLSKGVGLYCDIECILDYWPSQKHQLICLQLPCLPKHSACWPNKAFCYDNLTNVLFGGENAFTLTCLDSGVWLNLTKIVSQNPSLPFCRI